MGIQHRLRPPVSDLIISVAVAAVALIGAAIAPPGRTGLDAFGYLLLLAGSAALLARRRAPVPVLLVTTACVVAYLVRGYPGVAAAEPVMVALFTAMRAGRRVVVLVPKAALVVVVITDLTLHHGEPVRQVLQDRFLLAGWLVASAMMGGAFRQWDAYVHEARERAAEAERTREEMALRRAGEERLRIARELHDSLTHSISIVKVQAGVAIHLARKRGEPVPDALLAIQEASAEAMRELRATLEVLRDGEPTGNGLDRLPDLVRRARSAGLPADVTVTGRPRDLPTAVDRAAYRIVQEALTNVARHAGPAAASVLIRYGDDTLTVRVDDDGRATPGTPHEPGVGLTGMRERVTALGGRLRAEPRAGGGFTVHADLPTTGEPRADGHPLPALDGAGDDPVTPGRTRAAHLATDRDPTLGGAAPSRAGADHAALDGVVPGRRDTVRDEEAAL
ncbi:sensor histidine kinase [Actinoallomurus rhizosphaericola]|uniref:sensor histidine kinase n=1 Tax=Actinoallomurus rhizosphaericola TaxID=2952536 RepID=UPI0020933F0A|nr:sensor histidine kinase [Actinoallomurus rhizosphaericola]MCO5999606.1 sensor histidine kinase [Actinoallomurus rhizosphaericola]